MAVKIDDLLRMAMSFGASDLHLRAGSHPVVRINGTLKPLSGAAKLNQDETLEMAFSMMSNRQKQHFKEVFEVDIGYGVQGLGRFRVNIFQQRNSIGIVARVISDHIRGFEELGMPPILTRISDENRGLILVTGTTGSGKSTTLAAMVDHINETRNCHIVTVEDPIEFLHKNRASFVTQREVDVDTRNFAEALRGSLRQDPDVDQNYHGISAVSAKVDTHTTGRSSESGGVTATYAFGKRQESCSGCRGAHFDAANSRLHTARGQDRIDT
jgi:twitching motility protein PilT